MIDLILWAPAGKATFATFARNHPPANPLLDSEDNTREGVSYCWWAGDGQLMTALGEYDAEGNEITPPTYLAGAVALLRIHSDFFEQAKIADQNEEGTLTQDQRNSVAQYIINNGTVGNIGNGPNRINYVELDGVRIFRPDDVENYLSRNNLPGHIWVGGNAY